jgi:hypothetical protein
MAPSSRESSSGASSVYEGSTTQSKSTSSAPSSLVSSDGQNHEGNLPQGQDALLRSYCRLPCTLRILDCGASFGIESFDDWYAHSLDHFGSHRPPSNTICIFCDTTFQNDDSWRSWRELMYHIAEHFNNGSRIELARPDFALLHHLQANNLINEKQYDNAIQAQERLPVEGLRPHDWIPEYRRKQIQEEERSSNKIIHNQWRAEERIREHRRKDPRKVALVHHTSLSSQPEKPPEPPIEPVLVSGPDMTSEAGQFLIDPSSLLVDSDISSDDELSDVASLEEFEGTISSASNLPPDVDLDEDLVDPKRHRQRLRDIRDRAFKNSTALQLDYLSRVVVRDERNRPRFISDSYTDCCGMLRRMRQNMRMLQELGFCQGQLSFLKVDPKRTNVALLIAIPVHNILRLGEAFELGESSKPRASVIPASRFAPCEPPEGGSYDSKDAGSTQQAARNSISLLRRRVYHQDPFIKLSSQDLAGHAKAIDLTEYDCDIDGEPRHRILRAPDQPKGRFSAAVYLRL